ncbi:MAG: cyclic nucleotide-binding domain-containing protein [Pseudomonadota bacterium]
MRNVLYFFGDLINADVTWLAAAGTVATPKAGDRIVEAGTTVTALSIVLEGALEVATPSGSVLARLGAGDIVGEMSLIEQRLPEVSVRTKSGARILTVPIETLRDKLEQDQGFAARFYRALAILLSDRLRRANAEVRPEDVGDDTPGQMELDDGLLDNLHVAGDRMRRLLALLEGRAG